MVHADPGFQFLPLKRDNGSLIVDTARDPSLYEEWGIDLGDFEQGGRLVSLKSRAATTMT